MESQINLIKQKVNALLGQENSGHDMEHVNRVLKLSLKLTQQENATDWLNYLDNYLTKNGASVVVIYNSFPITKEYI